MKRFFLIMVFCVALGVSSFGQSSDTASQDTTLNQDSTGGSNPAWEAFKMGLAWVEDRATTSRTVAVYNIKEAGMRYGTSFTAPYPIDFANDKLRFSGELAYLASDRGMLGLALTYKPQIDLKVVAISNVGIIGDVNHGLTGKFDYGGGIIAQGDEIFGMSIQDIIEKIFFFLK